MDANTAIALGRQVLVEALVITAPILGVCLLVGMVMALFQALTSIQEQTLAMVPKLLALAGALFLMLPWLVNQLTDFTQRILLNLARLGGAA